MSVDSNLLGRSTVKKNSSVNTLQELQEFQTGNSVHQKSWLLDQIHQMSDLNRFGQNYISFCQNYICLCQNWSVQLVPNWFGASLWRVITTVWSHPSHRNNVIKNICTKNNFTEKVRRNPIGFLYNLPSTKRNETRLLKSRTNLQRQTFKIKQIQNLMNF